MRRKSLFRQQAIDHQQQRLPGDVLLIPRLSYAVVTGIILTWLGALVYFLCTHNYSRHATVTGWLEPERGEIRTFAQRQGTVTRLLVTQGERVEAGTPILELDVTAPLLSGASTQGEQIEQLQEQVARLETQQTHGTSLFKQQRNAAQRKLTLLTQDLETLSTMMTLASQRLELAETRHRSMRLLSDDGYISARELSLSTAETLQVRQEFQQLKREQTALTRQYDETASTLQSLPDEFARQTLTLNNQISDLQQRIVQLQSQQNTVVLASRAGIVSQLDAYQGQQLRAGQLVMTLAPDNSNIEARMVVPVTAAGFLAQGQSVQLRYDAFPFQKYGLHSGQITRISDTLMLPGDWPDAPVVFSEPGYLVRVTLDKAQLTAHGSTIGLKSGMTFSADIHLGQRSLLEWLLEPLLSIKGRV
ncbi:HlyD family secretion protein [Alteromonas halophila]|uniref:Toxin secretion, membrane fusion protein n=1 Tax=Alteromonas halophila TaxID=516698 RepID=A0A918MYT5_9ALTE|nr:HlyD family efflux transporter periplasmic adaptor subunit [Alteromonas halophila]GGW82846.1 toxin secretion, membrane fusion protein [Alteromonas halophila]